MPRDALIWCECPTCAGEGYVVSYGIGYTTDYGYDRQEHQDVCSECGGYGGFNVDGDSEQGRQEAQRVHINREALARFLEGVKQ